MIKKITYLGTLHEIGDIRSRRFLMNRFLKLISAQTRLVPLKYQDLVLNLISAATTKENQVLIRGLAVNGYR